MSAMESSSSNGVDIFDIYRRYCGMIMVNDYRISKQAQDILSQFLESRPNLGGKLFEDLLSLMSQLNLSADSHQFTCFYDFVFFLCRENGQKNIPVHKAIIAWRLVLTGRFRLLNQWCDFVQKHQRHNISLDTWQQILGFSRCVNEDLEGYDPKGAWPVLIDDFVEHMYRVNKAVNCCTRDHSMEEQLIISSSFSGLNLLPGSKRKCTRDISEMSEKRPRLTCHIGEPLTCAAEDNLSKVYDNHLLMGCCFQVGPTSGLALSLSNCDWLLTPDV